MGLFVVFRNNQPHGAYFLSFFTFQTLVLFFRSECLFRILRTVVFLRNEKDLRGVSSFLKTLVLFQKTGEERRAVLFPPRSV